MDIIYQDKNLLAVDKPSGINSDKELMEKLVKEFPELKKAGECPRYGLIHRLDKDTSGILLIAKDNKSLSFFQKQFKQKEIEKKYIALVAGSIKSNEGIIKTLIGRDKKSIKQRVYLPSSPESKRTGPRPAETLWKVLERYKKFTLIEASPKTGRKHQIRVHLAYIGHPVVGDKFYSFKNQLCPKNLKRQFLHSNELKIKLFNGQKKKFISQLPKELKQILRTIQKESSDRIN